LLYALFRLQTSAGFGMLPEFPFLVLRLVYQTVK